MRYGAVPPTWFLYVIQCSDASLYVGITTDLPRRIAEHNAGKGGFYTRGRRPVTLRYREFHASRSAAVRREAEIKRWPRAGKLALIVKWGVRRQGRPRQ